jgi:hypothetical protein
MYHIKENKKFLCGKKVEKGDISISMDAAGYSKLAQCCLLCKQEYRNQRKHWKQVRVEPDE